MGTCRAASVIVFLLITEFAIGFCEPNQHKRNELKWSCSNYVEFAPDDKCFSDASMAEKTTIYECHVIALKSRYLEEARKRKEFLANQKSNALQKANFYKEWAALVEPAARAWLANLEQRSTLEKMTDQAQGGNSSYRSKLFFEFDELKKAIPELIRQTTPF